MWKVIFVECRPVGGQRGVHRDPNAIAAQRAARFFETHARRCGVVRWKSQEMAASGYSAFSR